MPPARCQPQRRKQCPLDLFIRPPRKNKNIKPQSRARSALSEKLSVTRNVSKDLMDLPEARLHPLLHVVWVWPVCFLRFRRASNLFLAEDHYSDGDPNNYLINLNTYCGYGMPDSVANESMQVTIP